MNKYTITEITSNAYMQKYLQLLQQDFTIDISKLTINDFNNFVNNLNDYHQVFIALHNIDSTIDNANDNISDNTGDRNIDTKNNIIIGSITILIETKIIHNFGKVAHIEDVIVDKYHRGNGLGKMLIHKCIHYAKSHNCYKIILNCNDKNIPFYEKCGFTKKENEMALYF